MNGGVLFSKNSEISKKFFELWHEKWMETSVSGCFIDMPSLNYAVKQIGDSFAMLPDVYNVQISRSWEYFLQAKIIHFFTGWLNNCFESPYFFQKKSFWENIRQNGISESVVSAIENPLSAFEKKFGVYGKDELGFRNTALYGFIEDMYSKRQEKKSFYFLEQVINRISKIWK